MASSTGSAKVACIWGANGISGTAMIDTLTKKPSSEWSKIICVSRRPMVCDVHDNRIHFISIDILKASVDEIASELTKAGGNMITHVFHYTYIAKDDDNEINEVNKTVLQKALDATAKVAGRHVKCVLLQTGYKYYGVHKGPAYMPPMPFSEDAPRHVGVNFYYTQEDLVTEYAKKYHWNYVLTRPNVIIGVCKANFMNFALSLALYATIQKEKNEPLIFPGSKKGWNIILDHSTAWTNARFQLWAATNEKTLNQAFNIHNGEKVQFCEIWPKIEEYFRFSHHKQQFPANETESNICLPEWMAKQKDLWHQIAKRHNLDEAAFEFTSWDFANAIVNVPFDMEADMSKARKYGWTSTTDTAKSYIECFDRLKKMKIIPS